MRLTSIALAVCALCAAGIARDAQATSVRTLWTGTSGAGVTGGPGIIVSNTAAETLTLDIVLDVDSRGTAGIGISLEFDRDLADELDVVSVAEISWTNSTGNRKLAGLNTGIETTQESTGSVEGQLYTFEGTSGGQGPKNTTLTFARVVFVSIPGNVASDGTDIFSGFFNSGVDAVVDNTTPLAQEITSSVGLGRASVSSSAELPGYDEGVARAVGSALRFIRNVGGTAPPTPVSVDFGAMTDMELTGDWDGDGFTDVGVARAEATFLRFILRDPSVMGSVRQIGFGAPADLERAITGDWDGDGITDVGVWRDLGASGIQFLLRGRGPIQSVFFGATGDRGITGDWNGDGITDVGVEREVGANRVFILNDPTGVRTVVFGDASDASEIGITGDWDGNNSWEVGVKRDRMPSDVLFILNDPGGVVVRAFGDPAQGDQPVTGFWKP